MPIITLLFSFIFASNLICTIWLAPPIDWWIKHLPKNRLGIVGVFLILASFAVQSLQYWAVVLNIPVKISLPWRVALLLNRP